jgi:hypothetical protein
LRDQDSAEKGVNSRERIVAAVLKELVELPFIALVSGINVPHIKLPV